MIVEFVSATRLNESDFWDSAPLAVHLRRSARDTRISVNVAFENAAGLPEVYNARIDAPDEADILVFIHDDVWIEDVFFIDRVVEGLKTFDVIGVAGNRRRQAFQPAWNVNPQTKRFDRDFASGVVAHGDSPLGEVRSFGPVPAQCQLLDGVLLAARKHRLLGAPVHFDPRFAFHFYDLDFCRTATAAGLSLGTCPISVTHRSGGAYGSPEWLAAGEAYFAKWGD
jgi:hypothetical protein